MNKWLKSNIELLVADITDKFCEEKGIKVNFLNGSFANL
jgi:hypothetical protein